MILLSMLMLLAGSSKALAHANLIRSLPEANAVLDAAPGELRLWFSEAPEPRFTEVQLLNSTGQKIDAIGPLSRDGADAKLLVAPLSPLPNGVYTASWRATSAVDGHISEGAFAFVIGQGQALSSPSFGSTPGQTGAGASGPTLPGTANRWINYLAMALLTGVFAFFLFVFRPALNEAKTAPASARSRTLAIPSGFFIALELGLALAAVTTLIGAVMQAAASANVGILDAFGSPLFTLLGNTYYGILFWVRLLLLGLLLVLLATGRSWAKRASVAKQFWSTGLQIGALLLLTTTLSGHAAAGTSPIITAIADWLHLMAASVWIGGLVALLIALPWVRKTQGVISTFAISRMVNRFSRVATVCVVVLGVTGVFQAVLDVGDMQNLFDTPFGSALLIKLSLLVPLLGLAAVNLVLIKRRLADASSSLEPNLSVQPWYHHLRYSVAGEVLFVSALLLVTSVLVTLQPAREAFGPGQIVRGDAEDLRAVLVINPGQPGLNTFDVYLHDKVGRAVSDAEKVALIFTMVDRDIGETEAIADNIGHGHYLTKGGYVSITGPWHILVLVRRSGQDDVRVTLTFSPRQSVDAARAVSGDDNGGSGNVLLRLWLLLDGVLLLLMAKRLGKVRRWAGLVSVIVGITLIAFATGVDAHLTH